MNDCRIYRMAAGYCEVVTVCFKSVKNLGRGRCEGDDLLTRAKLGAECY